MLGTFTLLVLPITTTHKRVTQHKHTHPFNGPFSGTTKVSRYQKGKTNLDFTEARDSEWQWHQLGRKSAPRSILITMPAPHHSAVYRPDALPAAQSYRQYLSMLKITLKSSGISTYFSFTFLVFIGTRRSALSSWVQPAQITLPTRPESVSE